VSRPSVPFDLIAEARRQWVAHGWTEAADGMAVVTSVMRVQQLLLAELDDVLRPFGLTFARYEVLMLLHFSRHGALPLGKVGVRLQVAPGAVTNAVDRLEDDGLVLRQPHPTDGRTTLAGITTLGRHRALRATEQLNAVFEELTMTTAEQRRLVALLGRLRAGGGDSVA
jgi:DNA-binding MarR family transcriptional regulator